MSGVTSEVINVVSLTGNERRHFPVHAQAVSIRGRKPSLPTPARLTKVMLEISNASTDRYYGIHYPIPKVSRSNP